jgi:hypothetical protein
MWTPPSATFARSLHQKAGRAALLAWSKRRRGHASAAGRRAGCRQQSNEGPGLARQGLDLDYVPREARPLANGEVRQAAGSAGRAGSAEVRAVGISNAFGFGGHNAVLCLEAE